LAAHKPLQHSGRWLLQRGWRQRCPAEPETGLKGHFLQHIINSPRFLISLVNQPKNDLGKKYFVKFSDDCCYAVLN
jgi:hypothetical protein